MSQHTHLRHGSGRARQTHSSIASPPLPGSHTSFSEARISLDTLAAQPAAADTRDPRATFATLQIRTSLPDRTWSNPALTTCACLRNRKVARLAERAPPP